MKGRKLRTPEERVGTLPNGSLPPPARGVPPPPAYGMHQSARALDEEPHSIENLLRKALLGDDDQALALVIVRMRPEMLRQAASNLRSYDEAEDVIQETWVAARSAIRRYQGRASLRTWLLRILTYRARSALRRGRRFVPMSHISSSGEFSALSTGASLPGSSGQDPEEAFLEADLRRRLESAMNRLPHRQREVVQLRDFEGWSPVEVCARLNVSPANQRVLLHRGRTELRRRVAI